MTFCEQNQQRNVHMGVWIVKDKVNCAGIYFFKLCYKTFTKAALQPHPKKNKKNNLL